MTMRTVLFMGLALAFVAGAVAAGGVSPAAAQGPLGTQDRDRGRDFAVFATFLTGAAEPNGGDPDGVGGATIVLHANRGQVCFALAVARIAPANAAHIHQAPVGVNGPIVVPLTPPTNGVSFGCTSADRALISAIIANPAGFYVNVHNADFPGGALRGQLR
ncbi:MAG: CHRD domain-containing protein [Dehalococcoidia bacterium]